MPGVTLHMCCTVQRLERSQQYAGTDSTGFTRDIQQVRRPIAEVNIGMAVVEE